ncbi:unnamed protein product [Arctogadus glacialis]
MLVSAEVAPLLDLRTALSPQAGDILRLLLSLLTVPGSALFGHMHRFEPPSPSKDRPSSSAASSTPHASDGKRCRRE